MTSTMENLLATQQQIIEAIDQLLVNFRKDGRERKTSDYIRKRLSTLDSYWQEFNKNHVQLWAHQDKSHPYFTQDLYEKTKEKYGSIKALIQSYDPSMETRPSTPTLKPATPIAVPSFSGTQPLAHSETRGTNSKTDEMLKKQASNFRALQRTISSIDLDTVNDKWEFEDLLHTLQSRWSTIDTLHWEIDSEIQGANQEYEQSFSCHEQIYNNMKRSINNKLFSVSHREKSTPQMDVPMFNGNYHQWVSFKDLFTETIHKNPSISNAQKMQFLKSRVQGEAERLLRHLPISSDNYHTCWEILNHRYNNKKLIFTSHINSLLSIPSMQQLSLVQIKRLHDHALETLNAIKNLGVDISTWDPLLVHLLSQKLDNESFNDYNESLEYPRELPTIKDFLLFLETKFTTLETSRRKQEIPTQRLPSNQVASKNIKNKYQTFSNNNITEQTNMKNNNIRCVLCNNEHGIYYCSKFLSMTPQQKRNAVTKLRICPNCLFSHQGKSCTSQKRCRECQGFHNTILHEAYSHQNNHVQHLSSSRVNEPSTSTSNPIHQNQSSAHVSQHRDVPEVLLATAVIKVKAANGNYYNFRALLDQGSQTSIITERAAQLLALPRRRSKGVITGVGVKENNCKGLMNIVIKSNNSEFSLNTDVLIMKTLINNLPSCTLTKPSWSFLKHIQLADPEFYISRPIDLLLGAEVYSNIILDGICKENQKGPIAQQTHFGWILSGSAHETTLYCNVVLNHLEDIQKFWEFEDITQDQTLSSEDETCMEIFKSTTVRCEDGRYKVKLPLKSNFIQDLGASKNKAVAQFNQLERKFNRQHNIAIDYKIFINEYLKSGHMISAVSGNKKPEYFMPHHCVLRTESSTSALRVVFNASSKTSTGQSLNDLMYRGPNLQQDLQNLIIKWRQYKYAYTADLEKMFRQIWLSEDHQQYQKIVWRDSQSQPLQEYQLTTVTYGTKAAPFLAMMTLKQLASDEKHNYHSDVIKTLQECFYMDDLVHGNHTASAAQSLQVELMKLLKSGGFNLRKWSSNVPELLDQASENETFDFRQVETTKTLGLRWIPQEDVMTFQSKIESSNNTRLSKRALLSDISKIFDPLGWLSPLTTKLKLLFQATWLTNINWDDTLPDNIIKEWLKIKDDIQNINKFKIPRWIGTQENDTIQLHGFCDASIRACACVIYCKITREGQTTLALVSGKTRLMPSSKNITLPRMELCGAVLLAKLMKKVKQCLSNYQIKSYGWTDSTAVLGWLQGDPNKWKTFVTNRVKQVTDVIPGASWRYVKSRDNPADCASRGLTASQLADYQLWWQGPSWLLSYQEDQLPQQTFNTQEELKIKQQVLVSSYQDPENVIKQIINKNSSYNKLIRIVAWIRRIILRRKLILPSYLTLEEIRSAKILILKQVQQEDFLQEIEDLKKHNTVSSKSTLLNLHPYLDQDGIIRVGGRLRNAEITYEMKHPVILPHNHHLTNLIIDEAHILTFHGGARSTASYIRQGYWIMGGNRAVKKRLRLCTKCRRHDISKQSQVMGDLPHARSNPSRPFWHTGVDFTGYYMIKSSKGRGIKCTKGYVAVFVCMATKAIHLELVSDLTTSAFLAALKRMAARRGTPRHIYSDNGTNFLGASRALQQEYEQLETIINTNNEPLMREVVSLNIQWHFNAPSWPSAGGLWEAAVKSLKFHLKRVVGEQRLTYEEFVTVLSQLEACLNARPLCPLTEDADDLDYLTPSHFLASGPVLSIFDTEQDLRTRWYLCQKIFNDIWKRWRQEYLSQLTVRSKWKKDKQDIALDDVVIIHEDNLPAGRWAMGRVVQLHPGSDGHVRVVTLKTKNGYLKRPIVKLSSLPTKPTSQTSDSQTNNNQDNSIDQNKAKRPVRSRVNFSSLVLAILYFMTIITSSTCSFYNTPLKSNQGIYFDKIADMQVIRDNWKIVVYYDVDPYWQGCQTFRNYLNHLQETCNKIKETVHCEIILNQLAHSYSELTHYNNILSSQHSRTRSRRRRGLINGVGYLANSLFGVLDQQFAEQYQKDIKLIRNNQQHLALLWKNQTSIVEAEYNLLKRNEDAMNTQYKLINRQMLKIEKAVNVLNTEVLNMSQVNYFTLSAVSASNMIHGLQTIQESLLDMVTDIYHGRFNFHLLTPEQLRQELSIISSQISKELTLPINNIHTNIHTLYHLLSVKTRINEDYLLFEIQVPLISRDSYEIFHLYSVPTVTNFNKMINTTPLSDYVAVNLAKDAYITMKLEDITACQQQGNIYLCQLQRPIFHLTQKENLCEFDIDTQQCKTVVNSCQNKWLELNNINKYLYFCCERCQLRVMCADQVTAPQLERAGIVSISHGCIIKSDQFTVHAHNLDNSIIKTSADVMLTEINPINNIVNVSIPTSLIVDNITTTSDRQKLHQDIERGLKDMKEETPLTGGVSYHDVHHYVLIYVLVGAAAAAGAAFLWRRVRRARVRRAASAATPLQELTTVRLSSVRNSECGSPREQRRDSISNIDKSTSPICIRTSFVPK